MNIETKFNINDLITHKYSNGGSTRRTALEVMQIEPITCTAGTQVFYSCRLIQSEKEYINPFNKKGKYEWITGYQLEKDNGSACWKKFREDELIAVDEETRDIITGKIKSGEDKKEEVETK